MRLPACAGSMDHLAALAVEVGEVDRAPELRQRARLDLADPLARDAEMLAGLLERAGDAVVETVADAQDLLLALRERAEQAVELLVLELELDQALHRHRRPAAGPRGEVSQLRPVPPRAARGRGAGGPVSRAGAGARPGAPPTWGARRCPRRRVPRTRPRRRARR